MRTRDCIERHPYGVELDGPHRARRRHPLWTPGAIAAVLTAVILGWHFLSR